MWAMQPVLVHCKKRLRRLIKAAKAMLKLCSHYNVKRPEDRNLLRRAQYSACKHDKGQRDKDNTMNEGRIDLTPLNMDRYKRDSEKQ